MLFLLCFVVNRLFRRSYLNLFSIIYLGSSAKTYYITPTFQNSGSKDVKFRFPPGAQGHDVTLSPSQMMSTTLQQGFTEKPADMKIDFTEEGTSGYSVAIPWKETAIDQKIIVGNGEATVSEEIITGNCDLDVEI